MNTVQSIEFFVAINLFVIGASHFFQPKAWVSFFELLHRIGHAGNIVNALLALGMGSIVLAFHFVWRGPMALVSIYGLLLVVKGFIYLTFPQIGLNAIGRVNIKNYKKFMPVGLVMMIGGCLLFFQLFRIGTFTF